MKKKTCSKLLAINNLDGKGMDQACSAWKLFHIKVGLSPFCLSMNLHIIWTNKLHRDHLVLKCMLF